MEKILTDYFKSLNIPVASNFLNNLLQSHPDYPSILSIADVLTRLKLPYKVFRVDKERVAEIPKPFLLIFQREINPLILVKNLKEIERENLVNPITVLAIDQDSTIMDSKYLDQAKKETTLRRAKWLMYVVAMCLIAIPVILDFELILFYLCVTSWAGTFASYFLVVKDLGIKYDIIENFCKSSNKSDCDIVTNSKGARVLGILNLSEAAILYFVFQSILLSLSTLSQLTQSAFSTILICMSFLSIPIIFYSIYYQLFVIKIWCRLCMLINIVLIVQTGLFTILYLTHNFIYNYEIIKLIVLSGLILLLIITGWVIFKSNYQDTQLTQNELTLSNRIKRSSMVFLNILMAQRKVSNSFNNEFDLVFGNPNGLIHFVIGSNLNCSPCRELHSEINQLLELYPDYIKVSVRLVESRMANNDFPNRYLFQYWIENIQNKANQYTRTKTLFDDWFTIRDYPKFKNKYPILDVISDKADTIDGNHKEWLHKAGVDRTPTIFVNDYELPNSYNMNDLSIMIPSIIHQFEKSKQDKMKA